MASPASYEEIAQLLGDADAQTIERVRETGASAAEIAEATHRLWNGARLEEVPPAPSSARVAEVRAILDEHAGQPHDDDDEWPRHRESIESITAD